MKHRGTKILSLLLTLVLLIGVLPGMTAYAADTYILTVKYSSTTILTDSNYTLTAAKTIQGKDLNSNFGSFETVDHTGIVSDAKPLPDNKSISFMVNSDGIGTITCSYSVGAHVQYKTLDVTCVKTVPVNGVTLDPTSATLTAGGDPVALTAAVSPDDASDRRVKWKVTGSAVTLYSDENCTAGNEIGTDATDTLTVYAKGMSAGDATVTATSNADANKSASCAVTVNNGYTVHFDPNGGDGTMDDVTGVSGSYTLPDCRFDPPEGQSFKAWRMDGTSNEFAPGAKINIGRNTTFVAVWQAAASGGAVGFGGGDESWSGGYVTGLRAYRVSLAPMQGGSAALVLNTGESGTEMNVYPQTTVRVVPSPAPGYKLASIVWSLIDGSASYDITQAQTFVMPAMDAVVHVTFAPVG